MVSPLIARNIPVEFLTNNHYIFGQVKVANTGLIALLGDVNSSFIEISDASTARIVKPDKVINYASTTWLVKNRIIAASLNKREYIGASVLLRGGYTRILEYPVQVTTSVYEIQGSLEWSGRFDFATVMSDGTNPFIILYDAVLVAVLFPALHLESPAIIVNRNHVDSLVLMKKSAQEG